MSCRVTSFAKKCEYLPEGIDRIYLLDFDDFNGYKFTGDSLSDIADVEAIYKNISSDITGVRSPRYYKANSGLEIIGKTSTHIAWLRTPKEQANQFSFPFTSNTPSSHVIIEGVTHNGILYIRLVGWANYKQFAVEYDTDYIVAISIDEASDKVTCYLFDQKQETTLGTRANPISVNTSIGQNNVGNYPFNGVIYKVIGWDSVLLEEEIYRIMAGGLPVVKPFFQLQPKNISSNAWSDIDKARSLPKIGDVSAILYNETNFAILDASGSAQYTQGKSGKIYTHTIETFLEDFDAKMIRNLGLGVSRRFLVAFRTNTGRYYVLGQPGGATLTYELQTQGGSGAAITITCSSLAPLFETSLDAINATSPRSQYVPSFTAGAACELDDTGYNTGFLQASVAFRGSTHGGSPIDINGILTSVSGAKQAIALLEGTANPDPSRYEVAYTFAAGALVAGQSSLLLSTDSCPKGYLTTTPAIIAMNPGDTQIAFQLDSSSSWWVVISPANANIYPSQGSTGTWNVRVFFDTNAAINTVLTFQNSDGHTAVVTVTRDAYFGAFSDGYSNGFQN